MNREAAQPGAFRPTKMDTGSIGDYCWGQVESGWARKALRKIPVRLGEEPELSIAEVVRALSNYVIGLRAVNVSWDSGKMEPSDEQIASGWRVQNGYAITPAIDSSLIESWPMNSCSAFDEWYFFRNVPAEIDLEAFFNWGVRAVSDWPDLVACQPNSINLLAQLRQHEPELVIGEGRLFLSSREIRK